MLELHFLEELKCVNLLISDTLVSLPNQVMVCRTISVPFLTQLSLCYSSMVVDDRLLPFSKSNEPYMHSPAKSCYSHLYKWQLVRVNIDQIDSNSYAFLEHKLLQGIVISLCHCAL